MKRRFKYSFRLRFSEEDYAYVATLPEFPELRAMGNTPAEALEEAEQALRKLVKSWLRDARQLPDPDTVKPYSGQIRLRMPKALHQRVAEQAEEEGVSINTLIIQYVSQGLSFLRVTRF